MSCQDYIPQPDKFKNEGDKNDWSELCNTSSCESKDMRYEGVCTAFAFYGVPCCSWIPRLSSLAPGANYDRRGWYVIGYILLIVLPILLVVFLIWYFNYR